MKFSKSAFFFCLVTVVFKSIAQTVDDEAVHVKRTRIRAKGALRIPSNAASGSSKQDESQYDDVNARQVRQAMPDAMVYSDEGRIRLNSLLSIDKNPRETASREDSESHWLLGHPNKLLHPLDGSHSWTRTGTKDKSDHISGRDPQESREDIRALFIHNRDGHESTSDTSILDKRQNESKNNKAENYEMSAHKKNAGRFLRAKVYSRKTKRHGRGSSRKSYAHSGDTTMGDFADYDRAGEPTNPHGQEDSGSINTKDTAGETGTPVETEGPADTKEIPADSPEGTVDAGADGDGDVRTNDTKEADYPPGDPIPLW